MVSCTGLWWLCLSDHVLHIISLGAVPPQKNAQNLPSPHQTAYLITRWQIVSHQPQHPHKHLVLHDCQPVMHHHRLKNAQPLARSAP